MHVILIFTPTCPYRVLILCFLEKFNKWNKKWWEFKPKHMDKILFYKMDKFYKYLGMDKHVTRVRNLFDKIESSLDEIKYWTWYETLATIKQKEVVPHFLMGLPKTKTLLAIASAPREKGKQWKLIPFVSKNNDAKVLLAMMVELRVFIHDIEGLEHAQVLSFPLVSNIPMVKRFTAIHLVVLIWCTQIIKHDNTIRALLVPYTPGVEKETCTRQLFARVLFGFLRAPDYRFACVLVTTLLRSLERVLMGPNCQVACTSTLRTRWILRD